MSCQRSPRSSEIRAPQKTAVAISGRHRGRRLLDQSPHSAFVSVRGRLFALPDGRSDFGTRRSGDSEIRPRAIACAKSAPSRAHTAASDHGASPEPLRSARRRETCCGWICWTRRRPSRGSMWLRHCCRRQGKVEHRDCIDSLNRNQHCAEAPRAHLREAECQQPDGGCCEGVFLCGTQRRSLWRVAPPGHAS